MGHRHHAQSGEGSQHGHRLTADQGRAHPSLTQSGNGETAIDQQTLTCDESGFVAAQPGNHVANIVSPTDTPGRCQSHKRLERLFIRPHPLCHRRVDDAGIDVIDADAMRAGFQRKGADHGIQPALAGGSQHSRPGSAKMTY